MEIKTLAKNTAILASPKVIIFAIGLIKSKLIAVFLGTAGFGIISQVNSTVNFIRQSTLSFMPDGMVKLIAKENSLSADKKIIADIIKTYFLMVIPLTLMIISIAVVFADEMTLFILGDLRLKNYYLIGVVSLPLAFAGASLSALLKAFKEIKIIAFADIVKAILSFLAFIPLMYFLKVKGGVIHVTLTFFISTLTLFFFVRKNVFVKHSIRLRDIREAVFSIPYFKELITFIGIGMIAGVFRVFENMASRAIVVNELGIDKIGLYAPIMKWESLFIGFILPAVYTYLYPRLSEAKNDLEIGLVVNDVIRLITFITLPFVLIGIATRKIIIPAFFSREFMEAAIYLPFHFAFLLFAIWATILEQIFAPTGRLKIFLLFLIIVYSISLGLVYFLVPKYGLWGYLIKFTLTPVLNVCIYFFFWNTEISFKLQRKNLVVVLYALMSSFSLVALRTTGNWLQILTAVGLIAAMIGLLSANEKKFLLGKLRSIGRKN
jgi:PST family polysaccharide transporter